MPACRGGCSTRADLRRHASRGHVNAAQHRFRRAWERKPVTGRNCFRLRNSLNAQQPPPPRRSVRENPPQAVQETKIRLAPRKMYDLILSFQPSGFTHVPTRCLSDRRRTNPPGRFHEPTRGTGRIGCFRRVSPTPRRATEEKGDRYVCSRASQSVPVRCPQDTG